MYKIIHFAVQLYFKLFFGLKINGEENIPSGAVMLVGNHSHTADPIFISASVPSNRRMRIMGKAELFQFAPLRVLIEYFGAYPIERGASDLAAMKKTLEMFRKGEMVVIFPDGHRSLEENPENAKTGAAMLAVKSGAPVVPMYLTPDRRFLRRNMTVTFGAPYFPELPEGLGRSEGYRHVVLDMMNRVYALKTAQGEVI